MRRTLALFALFVAGCSTAPVADLLDYFKPGRMGPDKTPPYGGVCTSPPGCPPAAAPAPPPPVFSAPPPSPPG
jgi:hypothetical protein